MACHEVAALRLGLMNILGNSDQAERAHELIELGDHARRPGPLASLATATDLRAVVQLYSLCIVELHERVARTAIDDAKLPYLRSLLILTRKVELELRAYARQLDQLNRELDEIHDFVHELFPSE